MPALRSRPSGVSVFRGKQRSRLFAVSAAASLALVAGCSSSSDSAGTDAAGGEGEYPSQPVSLSVGSEPGSGWDTTARALVEVMQGEDMIPVNITVQNRPGAVGCVLLNDMVNSKRGEAHDIAMTSTPLFSNEVRGQCDVTYEDITPIARLLRENFLVAVPADSPFQDLGDLLDAIKADPTGVPVVAGGDDALPLALLVKAAGGDPSTINNVEFESGGETVTAMLNGDVAASMGGITEFSAQIEAGEFRALAILRDERLAAPFDDIPTATEQGYDVTLSNWRGVYGPPEMPAEAVTYWQGKLEEVTSSPAWAEIVERNQWQPAFLTGPELATFLEEEHAQIEEALVSIGEAATS